MHEDMEHDIKATCIPDPDTPGMQSITLELWSNHKVVGTLQAVRYALPGYEHLYDAANIVEAFDTHSANACGLAEELHRRRRAISTMSTDDITLGLIGILEIEVHADARGGGISTMLMNHLRLLHAGMPWNVALQAVPIKLLGGRESTFLAMRSRLIAHYARMGFERPSPRGSPELMITFWDGAISAIETSGADLSQTER